MLFSFTTWEAKLASERVTSRIYLSDEKKKGKTWEAVGRYKLYTVLTTVPLSTATKCIDFGLGMHCVVLGEFLNFSEFTSLLFVTTNTLYLSELL